MSKLYPCKCCGEKIIVEYGNFEICSNCGWEDDELQSKDPTLSGGANELCLNDYKETLK